MSQQNVEVVRRFFGAMERFFEEYWKEPRSVVSAVKADDLWPAYRDAMSCAHPDAEWQTIFLGSTHQGALEIARAWDDFLKWAEDYRVRLQEATDLGGDRVFAVLTLRGKTRDGDASMETHFFDVVTLREGSIVRVEEYTERDQAIEAAGLEEQAVSRENVERIVRDGWEAFNRGNYEECLDFIHPRIEWWPASDELIVEPYRGHDGYAKLFAETREGVPDIQAEIEELFVVGDQVVTCLRFWGRGRESGAPAEVRETHVARLRDGKIIEAHEYRTRAEALDAIGLSE